MHKITLNSFIIPFYYLTDLTWVLQLRTILNEDFEYFSFFFTMSEEKYRPISDDPEKLFYQFNPCNPTDRNPIDYFDRVWVVLWMRRKMWSDWTKLKKARECRILWPAENL